MDSFHHHQHHQQQQHDSRMLGQTMAGGGGGDHQWYPSSSPPPPPPPPGGYFNHPPPPHQQHSYHYPPPPPPPPPQPHLQQHQHHHPMGMGPPPPLHSQAQPPYHPYAHHSQYPPLPLPPRPLHPLSMPHHPPPPLPSAYPPPTNQAWGNPSWAHHHGRDYPERTIPYNNEEDWAARAKAWASAKSGAENHHAESHFTSVGRTDEHSYPYHDQYQQAVGPPRDVQQPSFPQSSNQQLPVAMMDPLKQVNHLHGSTFFSSGSSSYGTGYNVGDVSTSTNADHRASPHKSFGPSSSVYEQEVSYSYSSAPGNREAVRQSEGSHVPVPLPASSVQEGYPSQSTLPGRMISAEPHFSNHGAPINFLPDSCDRPLDFEQRHDSELESYQKINYGHAGLAGAVGMVDHDPASSSIPAWTPSTAPGVVFPQIPLGPSGTQFDPSFIPQASLPVQPSPVFGGTSAPSFQSSVPPVSAPYGLIPGASLHAAAFSGDLNGALNPSERPKKAAVPNWLREEIIKKKSVIPSAISTQPPGNSLDSIGSEDGDRSLRRADQGDSKSIDSTRSTEDEEDDEEDVEAAKSAAINQEIKRVLTEVLLKVTDELFDEIATKVLNEDEQTVGEAEESAINGNRRVSPPTAIPTPNASAKILVPLKMETNKVDTVGEHSSTSSPGGNVLGLANYASDDDDDDDDGNEIQSSQLLSSGKKRSAPHEQERNVKPSENDFKSVKDKADIDGVAKKNGAGLREESYMMKNGSLLVDNLNYPDKASEGVSAACELIPVDRIKVEELPSESAISIQSKDFTGTEDDKGKESTSGHAKSDKALTKDYRERESRKGMGREDNKASMEKTSRETSGASDSIIHEDRNKHKEKKDKRDKLKERVDDRSSERGTNVKDSDSKRSSKHNSAKDDKKETAKDKREKYKEDGERKRERARDEKEDRPTRATKDSSRYSRRSPSPSGRGKNVKDNSFSHGSASGDEPSDNSKKRKKLSHNSSLSPSPTKSRKRQVSRSPPSKHSHRRHSPYSSTERRRRSRSASPGHRRSSTHKHSS